MPEELCGKTIDAVVPQRLGGRNWKTVRQSSLPPSHSHSIWADEKSKYSLSRSVALQSPPLPPFLAYSALKLYLARTKPLCHLIKGLFFFFFYRYFCAHRLGILYYLFPLPLPCSYFKFTSVRTGSSRKLMSSAYSAQLMLQLSSSVGFQQFLSWRPWFYFYHTPPEERPGHHVKLYQYGSSDIHDIVQRHLRVCPDLWRFLLFPKLFSSLARWREGYSWSPRFFGKR